MIINISMISVKQMRSVQTSSKFHKFLYILCVCCNRLLPSLYTPTIYCPKNNFKKLVFCFLLGNSPASEFYMPTFRNTLFHLHRRVGTCPSMKLEQSVPKRRHIKFRRRGITQKKAYNIQKTAKVGNQ